MLKSFWMIGSLGIAAFCFASHPEELFNENESATAQHYSPEFIQAKVEITGRSFYDYLRRLGIAEKEVLEAKGQKWLSVGEGNSDFTAQAIKRGVDSWALDAVVKNPHAPEHSKLGLAQQLPFADQEFHRVVSIWLVDAFFNAKQFNDPVGGKKAILEMIRVTKVGGDIRINPISEIKALLHILDELKHRHLVDYQILPYFAGRFKLDGKERRFAVDPAPNSIPGSVKIVRLK